MMSIECEFGGLRLEYQSIFVHLLLTEQSKSMVNHAHERRASMSPALRPLFQWVNDQSQSMINEEVCADEIYLFAHEG